MINATNTAWHVRISTSRYRQVLWTAQLLGAACLAGYLLFPAVVPFAVVPFTLILALMQFAISWMLGNKSVLQLHERQSLLTDAESSRRQIEQLFAMTDMLQSAEDHDDAGAVLEATATHLLPDFRGALYIFNNSRDRLDLARYWPHGEDCNPSPMLVPGNCWALKRGKAHINLPKQGGLCCGHNNGTFSTLEIPMVARGKVHGLLMLACDREDGAAALEAISRIARALADSMSLALSNIALREKLRTQSLRDPLTGLYNRRYMEDALERCMGMAEKAGAPTSVIMIDLDHFKKLNDAHGHALGDAVLRDVAAQLVSASRPSDIVSRYGGEELLVILPQCSGDDAALKAEILRSRIEGLSDVHGITISASMGVASAPDVTNRPTDLISRADAALYAAKKAGRNCVEVAARLPSGPHLAVG